MRLVLYQPDIPQNTGTLLRMAACLGIGIDIVGPAGFDMSDRSLRRAGLDYLGHVDLFRHPDWTAFEAHRRVSGARLVLASTHGAVPYTTVAFKSDDLILLGRESAGVPAHVHEVADVRVRIPLVHGLRSLNIAVAGAIIVGEALRQTGAFPDDAAAV